MPDGESMPPISDRRSRDCLESATFWVDELPRYADRNQRLADRWAIAAGLVAAVTGLAIWPASADSTSVAETALVSAGALWLPEVCLT